jgi:F0F1-type ATP synthase membrane subunit b/b'
VSSEFLPLIPYFINFGIVVVLCVVLFHKPLHKYVYQRHERMRDAVESAAVAHRKATDRAEAAKRALEGVSQEEKAILSKEAAGAELEKQEVLEKAQSEARRVTREADRLAGVEQEEATDRVKTAFLNLVVHETEESLKRGLKEDDHSAILRRAQNSIEVGV